MLTLPRIGQGTWDVPESGARMQEAIDALRTGIALGMTHIDTAEMYGNGRAEEIVGEAVSGIPRDSLFVTSKVLPGNATYDGTIAACERSLKRLRMDYLDLYLLHWPSRFPLKDTMRALEQLVRDGKARAIGVSNFDLDDVREAQSYLQNVPLACNQVLYHLRERGIETRLIPYCTSNGIAVVGYTPFGRSRFPRPSSRGGAVLEQIAAKYGKTVRQIVLNFLTRMPHVYTIPKASRSEHARENAGAAGWDLEQADIDAIDEAFPVEDGPLATI
ncbi:MAG TPA: aldo/keto reductase [Candidatus Baltobacteraceae bacterium]|nr:aldo/keto reductase [Candidatus Baltobacteraceae bacterium]